MRRHGAPVVPSRGAWALGRLLLSPPALSFSLCAVMEGAGSLPSNEDVAQNLEAMKIKDELPREKLSETGKEVSPPRMLHLSHARALSLDAYPFFPVLPCADCLPLCAHCGSWRSRWTAWRRTASACFWTRTARRTCRRPRCTPRGPPRSHADTSSSPPRRVRRNRLPDCESRVSLCVAVFLPPTGVRFMCVLSLMSHILCLLCVPGEEALEEARKGLLSGVNLARLIVMSPEFRDELSDGLGNGPPNFNITFNRASTRRVASA